VELVDSLILAGATTLIYPMFGQVEHKNVSIESLGHVLVLLQIYSMLPSNASASAPIAAAVREASLWLKSATCNHIIEFLNMNTAIELTARDELLKQLQLLIDRGASGGRPGERKLFTHPFYWGSFTVSGHGGGLIPPPVPRIPTAKDKSRGVKAEKRSHAKIAKRDKEDMNNIRFEIAALRGEGNEVEANQLKAGLDEIHRKQIAEKRDQIASHINNAKQTGSKAKNWIVDRLKQLDRAILVQDSDEEEEGAAVEHELGVQDEHQSVPYDDPPDNRRTPGLISEDSEDSEKDALQKMRRARDDAEQDDADQDDGSYGEDGDEDSDDDRDNKNDDRLYHDKRTTR
jgi:hypothetical protein